ncbi:MAG: uracil-DNA glycosylase [Nanoarchaeota archaeon]|nr:uracil-DNA glycosylase [Nanoarchaeota archaeon]MBU1632195.1 uracil-DNA glycosylase [Nanoarchaeota archaeon]MBU1875584.1 uracil-DNA glycosylase [Nanoarchaeota archaeon]
MSFDRLKEEYFKCTKCDQLCKSRSQVVFGSGNPQADVLFIGEAPGFNEDKEGIPFCGMSGKVLNELLNSVSLSREDIFITNTILCRPENNRNPAKEEVSNCRERLDKLIFIMNPKVIVTIGNFATERILGKTGIKSLKGKIFSVFINEKEVKVVPVIHPASYLYSGRNPQMFEQMKNDFKVIASVISENKKQKNLWEF